MPAKKLTLYYATNRGHVGAERFAPDSYGSRFSQDGSENLRFGKVSMSVDAKKVSSYYRKRSSAGNGDGDGLAAFLAKQPMNIEAYAEDIPDRSLPAGLQPAAQLGSKGMFDDLRAAMSKGRDLVIYVHGYAVSWERAVGSALSLQLMLNRARLAQPGKKDVVVALYSWPSDGSLLPFEAYKSDRTDAVPSGYSLGRALLKLHDYLCGLTKDEYCGQGVHIVCHSMGNYVLQHALERIRQHAGSRLPRILDNAFLCAADVDEDALEVGEPLAALPELCRSVSVYFNWGDTALHLSDYTKNAADRLGTNGAARPNQLHRAVEQVDCSEVVSGLVEHAYYMDGRINRDIRRTIDGVPHGDRGRDRRRDDSPQTWVFE